MLLPVFAYFCLLPICFFSQQWQLLALSSAALLFIVALLVLRWWRWGYAVDQEFIYIRKGLLGIDRYCFPIHKTQQTCLQQSLLMKRQKLCSIKLILACGGQIIPYIPVAAGKILIDQTLHKLESSKRPWM